MVHLIKPDLHHNHRWDLLHRLHYHKRQSDNVNRWIAGKETQ